MVSRHAPGPLMIDLIGPELAAEERELLAHPHVGGVILFARNFHSPSRVRDLIARLRACREGLLIAVDQEGGRVQRFRDGLTRLPPMARLGETYARDQAGACSQARDMGWLMAAELRALDVDISFAPVLDLGAANDEVIGDRAFAATADAVTALAGAWIEGMAQAGMPATGKHFPGHGSVRGDSHHLLPEDARPLSQIRATDLVPFAQLAAQGLPAVMAAHVLYSAVDAVPASFSHYWLQTVLRGELAFDGAVFCDDLCMAGAGIMGDMLARAECALAAGCDMLPVCNSREDVVTLLDQWRPRTTARARERLVAMRGRRVAVPDPQRLSRAAALAAQLQEAGDEH